MIAFSFKFVVRQNDRTVGRHFKKTGTHSLITTPKVGRVSPLRAVVCLAKGGAHGVTRPTRLIRDEVVVICRRRLLNIIKGTGRSGHQHISPHKFCQTFVDKREGVKYNPTMRFRMIRILRRNT